MNRQATTASRWLLAGLCAVVLGLLGFTGDAPLSGAEPGPKGPRIRRLYVPVDQPSRWPAGDWRPMPLADFEAALDRLRQSQAYPATAVIDRAEYSATVVDGMLRGGHVEFSTRRLRPQPAALSLAPLNLSLSELGWSDTPAVWGTTSAGDAAVVLDRDAGKLIGEWTLAGRQMARSVEFQLRLAPASASRMALRVPVDVTLHSPAGVPMSSEPGTQPGWKLWHLELGSRTELTLVATRSEIVGQKTPLVLVKRDLTYVVRHDAVRVQADYQVEVLDAPIQTLRLQTSAEEQILAVTLGDNTSLNWKSVSKDGSREIVIHLPEPQKGQLPPLRVQAISRSKIEPQWSLPPLRLVNTVLVDGLLTIRIQPPLQAAGYKLKGCRQIGTTSSAAEGETVILRQWRPDASVSVVLETPRFDGSCRVLTAVQTFAEQWTATTQLNWSARSGSSFTGECLIPAGWEVTDVRLEPTTGFQTQPVPVWDIVSSDSHDRRLRIDFQDSLAAGRPKRVRVLARHHPLPLNQATPVPAFLPVGIDDVELIVGIATESAAHAVLEPKSHFESIREDEVPDLWQTSDLWKERLSDRKPAPLLLQSRNPAAEGSFRLQPARDVIDVDVQVAAVAATDHLLETYNVQCSPQNGSVSRVLIYLSEPGPAIQWQLGRRLTTSVKSRKLPAADHAAANLPPEGELWEIRLDPPKSGEFYLRGARQRPLTEATRVGLAAVRPARQFRGIVYTRVETEAPFRFIGRGVERLNGTAVTTTWNADRELSSTKPGGIRWEYRSLSGELQVQPVDSLPAEAGGAAALLAVHVRPSLLPLGFDLYSAEFQLTGFAEGADLRWILPADVTLSEVTADNRLMAPQVVNGMYRISTPGDQESFRLQLQYRVPSQGVWGPNRRALVIPQVDFPILHGQLILALPGDVLLEHSPREMELHPRREAESWSRILFGDIGQSSGTSLFKLLPHWLRLRPVPLEPPTTGTGDQATARKPAGAGPSRKSQAGGDWLQTCIDEGCTVWQGEWGTFPQGLHVVLWQREQVRLLSWSLFLAVLCGGLLLRLSPRWSARRWGLWLLAACVFGIVALPSVYAELAGSGLAAIIVATLIPSRFLTRPRPVAARVPVSVPPGSTQSFAIPPLLLVGICSLFWTIASLADDGRPRRQFPDALVPEPRFDVLVPIDSTGKPSGSTPVVFIPPGLVDLLAKPAPKPAILPDYLIASAKYTAELSADHQLAMTAVFEVHVLGQQPSVRINLPLENLNLGGSQACLVDGKPQSVLQSPDGRGIAIELSGNNSSSEPVAPPVPLPMPADQKAGDQKDGDQKDGDEKQPAATPPASQRTPVSHQLHRIQLRLRPMVETQNEDFLVRLGIPVVCQGELQVDHQAALRTLELSIPHTTRTLGTLSRGPRQAKFALDQASELQLRWSAEETPVPAPDAQVSLGTLVEVYPTFLQYRVQATYRVVNGRLPYVNWRLPERASVRQVSGVDLLAQSVEDLGREGRRLVLEFAQPQTGEFRIAATIVLPADGIPDTITVPLISPFDSDDRNIDMHLQSQQIALRPPADFRIELLSSDWERFRLMSIEEFQKQWNFEGTRPQSAYSVHNGNELSLQLQNITSVLKARSNTAVRIGRNRIDYNFTAEIETLQAPTFSYRFDCPEPLRVTSVSVREDGAERLLRWTRKGDQLVLFLADKSLRVQSLQILASMPLQVPQKIDLPLIRLAGGGLTSEARLALFRGPDVEVEPVDADTLIPMEVGADPGFGKRDVLVARYSLPGTNPASIRLNLTNSAPRITAQVAALLTPKDRTWRTTTAILFRVHEGRASQLELSIPRELASRFEIDSHPAMQHSQQAHPDGSMRVLLSATDTPHDEYLVTVTASFAAPEQPDWQVPVVRPAGSVSVTDNWLLIPSGKTVAVSAHPGDSTDTTGLPDELRQAIPGSEPQDSYLATHQTGTEWNLRWGDRVALEQSTAALLVDTQVWLQASGRLTGETWICLPPSRLEKLVLDWPTDLHATAGLVDGRLISLPSPKEGQLTLELPFSTHSRAVVITWSGEPALQQHAVTRIHRPLPRPHKLTIDREFVSIHSSPGYLLASTAEAPQISATQVALDRWEVAMDLERQQRQLIATGNRRANPWLAVIAGLRDDADQAFRLTRFDRRAGRVEDTQLNRAYELAHQTDDLVAAEQQGETRPRHLQATWGEFPRTYADVATRVFSVDTDQPPSVEVWVIRQQVVRVLAALLAGIGLLIVGIRIQQFGLFNWLQQQEVLAWLTLGLFWWLCLQPAALGVVLCAFGLWRGTMRWFAARAARAG